MPLRIKNGVIRSRLSAKGTSNVDKLKKEITEEVKKNKECEEKQLQNNNKIRKYIKF